MILHQAPGNNLRRRTKTGKGGAVGGEAGGMSGLALFLLLAVFSAGGAWAASSGGTTTWTGLGDGVSWNDVGNWNNGAPGVTKDVMIDRDLHAAQRILLAKAGEIRIQAAFGIHNLFIPLESPLCLRRAILSAARGPWRVIVFF